MRPVGKEETEGISGFRERQHLGVKRLCGANYSLLFYVPRQWIKKYGIKADSQVDVIIMSDGSLLLRPSKF